MAQLNEGDIITDGSTLDPAHLTDSWCALISTDGARQVYALFRIGLTGWGTDSPLTLPEATTRLENSYLERYTEANVVFPARERILLYAYTGILPIAFYPVSVLRAIEGIYSPPVSYLGYDYRQSATPVNQVVKLREWRPIVARAMHGYEILRLSGTFADATSEQRRVIGLLVHGLLGHAWWALTFWAGLVDRAGTPLPIWEAGQNVPQAVITAICSAPCNTETWARRALRRIDVAAFAADLDAGRIPTINTATTPWSPGSRITSQSAPQGEVLTATSIADFHASLKGQAEKALDHYDDHVAHIEAPHGHDDE